MGEVTPDSPAPPESRDWVQFVIPPLVEVLWQFLHFQPQFFNPFFLPPHSPNFLQTRTNSSSDLWTILRSPDIGTLARSNHTSPSLVLHVEKSQSSVSVATKFRFGTFFFGSSVIVTGRGSFWDFSGRDKVTFDRVERESVFYFFPRFFRAARNTSVFRPKVRLQGVMLSCMMER